MLPDSSVKTSLWKYLALSAIFIALACAVSWVFLAERHGETSELKGEPISRVELVLPDAGEQKPHLVTVESLEDLSVVSPGDRLRGDLSESDYTDDDDALTLLATLDLPKLLLPELFNAQTLEVFQRMHIALDVDAEHLDRHFEMAQAYLSSQLENPEDIAALMAFYRRYTEFELSQSVEPATLWREQPQDADAAIALNEAKQEYRRAWFGRDIADQVWGDWLKEAAYHQRMLALVRDESYGDDTSLRAQMVQTLPDYLVEPGREDLTRLHPKMYVRLVRNGEALLTLPDQERQRTVQAYWQEIADE